MWIEDDLSVSGSWQFQHTMAEVINVFSRPAASTEVAGARHCPEPRTRIDPRRIQTTFVT
jgi:hypothetical protein